MKCFFFQFTVIPIVLFQKIAPKSSFQIIEHEFFENCLQNLQKWVFYGYFGVFFLKNVIFKKIIFFTFFVLGHFSKIALNLLRKTLTGIVRNLRIVLQKQMTVFLGTEKFLIDERTNNELI